MRSIDSAVRKNPSVLRWEHQNVFVEYSIDVARYRLCCKKCGNTLTYADGYMADRETVDDSLQKFAKLHRHPPEELKNAQSKLEAAKKEAQEKLQGLLKGMNFKNPAAVVKELSNATCNECGESCPCSQHGFGFAKYTRTNTMKQGRKFRQ